ncbi:uncharacterized protein LOC118277169 [Spodoptera frugiperda]|uniref:Uncharacterized protein LOC118277169 n=1 Tax=Spodoptera frugiperda TaxID=7108 RepID=A0A9R0DFS6_SPOFR|nr:uncharacterized protein LOC118277169 [Spodoptera frugiperda]
MRSFIIITVLSALAACYAAAVLPSEEMSEGYSLVFDDMSPEGRIVSNAELNARSSDWILISEGVVSAPAVLGQVQRVGTWHQADLGVRIERLALAYGAFPADVQHTPLGSNFLEVRIISAPSQRVSATISAYRRAF